LSQKTELFLTKVALIQCMLKLTFSQFKLIPILVTNYQPNEG